MPSNLKCAVVIPVYRPIPSATELFSLSVAKKVLRNWPRVYICPLGMGYDFYRSFDPDSDFRCFGPEYFESNKTYSRLCLSEALYESFNYFDYILIIQTDAIVLSDRLAEWCTRGYDYIGAPLGVSITVNDDSILDDFVAACSGYRRGLPIGAVGNGGFSLRNIPNTLRTLNRYSRVVQRFSELGLPEDVFFAYAGLSNFGYKVPSEGVASLFAVEMNGPQYILHNRALPFGVHAWQKYDPGYWEGVLTGLGLTTKSIPLEACQR